MFIRDSIPLLVKAQVLGEEWIQRDKQHRYHLTMSMERVHEALRRASTSVADFLAEIESKKP